MTRHATLQTSSPGSVLRMDSCWQDDEDLCDIRSDATLLRMLAAEGGLLPRAPTDMLGPVPLPAWLHWTLGTLYSITGEIKQPVAKCVLQQLIKSSNRVTKGDVLDVIFDVYLIRDVIPLSVLTFYLSLHLTQRLLFSKLEKISLVSKLEAAILRGRTETAVPQMCDGCLSGRDYLPLH